MCTCWIAYLYMDYRIQKRTFYEEGFNPFDVFKRWRKKDKFVKNNWSEDDKDFIDVETKMTQEETEAIKTLLAQVIEERVKNLDLTDSVEKIDINGQEIDVNVKFNYKD